MSFEEKRSSYVSAVNDELKKAMRTLCPRELVVSEAMEYSLMAGGKRVRPIIALGVCEALGGDMREALVYGCALEMIHTYSLIHDDMPCMDDDTLRRGAPTCHVKFGEAYALLAGDALLTAAFEYITKSASNKAGAFEYIACLAERAGISGMVGGQTDDLKSEGRIVSVDFLRSIHRRKTGALINAAGSAGALAAGKETDFAIDYTKSLGLAFQIKDDILDVEGDEAKMGKTLLKDISSEKSTFATLLGLEEAKREMRRETEKAISACEIFGEKGDFLRELANELLVRQN